MPAVSLGNGLDTFRKGRWGTVDFIFDRPRHFSLTFLYLLLCKFGIKVLVKESLGEGECRMIQGYVYGNSLI